MSNGGVSTPVIFCVLCCLLHQVHIDEECVEPKLEQLFLKERRKEEGRRKEEERREDEVGRGKEGKRGRGKEGKRGRGKKGEGEVSTSENLWFTAFF